MMVWRRQPHDLERSDEGRWLHRSFVAQSLDGIHVRSAEGGVEAEDHSDEAGNSKGEERGPKGHDSLHSGGVGHDQGNGDA